MIKLKRKVVNDSESSMGSVLRSKDRERIAKSRADLVVGIPTLNCAHTVNYVAHQVTKGLIEYFPDDEAMVLVSDGRSTDGTLDVVNAIHLSSDVKLFGFRHKGIGKGVGIKAILEAAKVLAAQGVAIIDGDVRSVTPEWTKLLLGPTIRGTDLVVPLYKRHKYDATITNNICFPFTLALYGKKVRQPIGGEFGLSRRLYEQVLRNGFWKNPYTPKFGVDITITHTALGRGYGVKQAMLGAKIHDPKDPRALAPMFEQVTGAMFTCMIEYENVWRTISGVEAVPIVRGERIYSSPEPVSVDAYRIVADYKAGIQQALGSLRRFLPIDLVRGIEKVGKGKVFDFPTELWIKILYSVASSFKKFPRERRVLLDVLRILWIGRVGSFVSSTTGISDEEAEAIIVKNAGRFVDLKDYLLRVYSK